MRKFIVTLALLLCLTTMVFSGCDSNSATPTVDPDGSQTSTLSGEISFSTWGSLEEKKVNEDIIALFEEQNPGVKVNLEYIPSEYTTTIDTMFLGNRPPDVIYGHPRYFTKWASQGLLMDLTDKFAENPELLDDTKYQTSLYDAFTFDGKQIATVNGADTFLLFYNKDLFDAANVEYPNDDWTWQDLAEAAQKLTVFDENGKPQQYGIAVDTYYPWIETVMYSHGARWYDDMNNPTEVLFDSPETVKALQFIQDLIYKYKAAPSSSDSEVLGGSFDSGKVAMVIDGVWAVVYRSKIEDFEWDLANIPVAEGAERKTSCLYAGYAIPKSTDNPDLAWAFAKFMQSDDAQRLLASSGLITTINLDIANSDEALNIPGGPEHHALRVTSLDYAIHNDALTDNWEETLTKAFDPNIQLLINNDQDAATTARKIHEKLEELLREAE